MTISGSEWLPSMPERWRVVPAKALFALRSEPNRSDDQHLTPSQKYGVVPQADYMEMTGSRVVLALTGADSMQHVEPGDFVIHLRSFQGGIEYSHYRGKVSPAYTVLRPRAHVHAAFYRHMLKSERYIQALRVTVNQLRDGQSIRYQDFGKAALPLPPIGRQVAIADFLDRETAKIDALVEKQRGMDGLLAERRTSVIEGTLSRTGREAPLASACSLIQTGPFGSQLGVDDYVFGGVPVINPLHLSGGRIIGDPGVSVSSDTARRLERHALRVGDVIAARRGELGRCAEVTASDAGALCGTGSMLLRPRVSQLSPSYLQIVLSSRRMSETLMRNSVGSTMANLNASILGQLKIPLPAIEEQKEIVAHLAAQSATIDNLRSHGDDFVRATQERRAALITAAVTGQLDIGGAA